MARMINSKKDNSILEESKRSILQIIFSRTMLIMLLIVLQFAYIIARMYTYAEHLPILLGGEFLIIAVMLIIILNSKENPMIKLSWCFLVGIFPIFGSIVYLVVRYDLGYRMQQKRILETEKEVQKDLPEQEEVMKEIWEKDPQTYHIATYLREKSASSIYKNTKVTYLPIGEKQFEEMLKQLENAKDFIFMEYFMIGHGHMWRSILQILIQKVKEGVDVRLLYDGSCAVYLLPYKYPEKLERAGIQCRMFSPPIPFISTHYNNRDHRKILVIDGKIAFTGGVNLCDEYININSPCGHWKDVGVMLQGDAVSDFTRMFLQMWIATEPAPAVRNQLLEEAQMNKYLRCWTEEKQYSLPVEDEKTECICMETSPEGYVIPYCDSPVDKENVGEMVYLDILNQAKDYVYIMTPYLILDNEMLTAISFAAKRGIDVRIILPHIPDKKTAFVLAKENYKDLLEAGVKIFEYTPGFVHAKVFVSDDSRAVVGTVNLDYRSLYWHYECSAYLYEVPAIMDIKRDYYETLQKSQQVTIEDVKARGFFSRLAGVLLKLVAPLM